MAYKVTDGTPYPTQARVTTDVNYYGTARVLRSLFPLVRKNGRVVTVASQLGISAIARMSPEIAAQFRNPEISEKEIDQLVENFVQTPKGEKPHEWPSSPYGVSKAALLPLTTVYARAGANRGIFTSACCPGWCRTDMGGQSANLSAEEGARTPVFLALIPDDKVDWKEKKGQFFMHEKRVNW
eukprot:GHVT01047673.1.p1 GENE.GHVT01047673.1~~GHVT01047673.1.p1  ORF type:complete len:183 (-),score=25.36 GHVT01047673.1:632-1180(-)